tara:strand:- start:936 stop:1736 length:801 start_codon:yes stop_codon:yes gene_type:complete
MNDWDVSKIIDKTERWLFDDIEDNSDKKEVSLDDFNGKELTEEEGQVEEVFPDINDVPQIQPEFEEIDESFFESEGEEIENNDADNNNIEVSQINQKDNIKNEGNLKKKNISAVLEVRKNIRFKLAKMLLDSDPPVDKQQPVIDSSSSENIKMTKVAIIQFPDNAIIPDNSADKVLEEIAKFKGEKKIRLVGHASKTGSETIEGKRINMEISISRAQTIKNILINKGLNGNNIEVFGKGDLEPLQKEAEEFGEAVNRRVEVFFISN